MHSLEVSTVRLFCLFILSVYFEKNIVQSILLANSVPQDKVYF